MFKKKRNIILASVLAIIIILLIVIKVKSSEQTKRAIPTPSVVTGKITKGEIESSITLTGDILPVQQANIYSKVNGNIEKLYVDIGSHVKAGQVLALIDTTIYSQNVRQALASLRQAAANYENNKTNYNRNKTLFEQNLISKQDLDNSRTTMEVAESQKEAASAAYSNARTQLGYCKITAPFSGYITKRTFDPGAYVTSSGNNPSSTLFMLMNVDELISFINLPEKEVPRLNQVQAIEVTADAIPDTVFNARLEKVSQAVDLSTRTMTIEVGIQGPRTLEVDPPSNKSSMKIPKPGNISEKGTSARQNNPMKMLKPGMFASIRLIFERKSNSLILPDQVIQNDNKGDYVFVLNHDTTVSKKYIKLGIRQNNKNEILAGIDEQENIVFVGQNLIKDKMKVRLARQ